MKLSNKIPSASAEIETIMMIQHNVVHLNQRMQINNFLI